MFNASTPCGASAPAPETFALNNDDVLRIDSLQIAGRTVAVADGVYRHPERVRAFALTLDFQQGGGLYPGRLAFAAPSDAGLLRLVNRLLSGPAGGSLVVEPTFRGRLTFAILRQAGRDLLPMQRQPHFDSFCDVAGVLYLSPPEHCQGGTSFWRHRRSGLAHAPRPDDPELPALLERFAARTECHLIGKVLKDGLAGTGPGYAVESNGHWERLAVVPMRCNRLVLYDARLFHSAHVSCAEWQPDPGRPRLTQNLYLNRVPGLAQ
jgi:hypothetical protein